MSSVFTPGNFQDFGLVNRQRTSRISTGFTVEVSTEGTQLSYSNFDYLGQEPHYWQLPGVYQGDKVSTEEQTQQLNPWKQPEQNHKPSVLHFRGLSCTHQKPVDRSSSLADYISLLFLQHPANVPFQANFCRCLSLSVCVQFQFSFKSVIKLCVDFQASASAYVA